MAKRKSKVDGPKDWEKEIPPPIQRIQATKTGPGTYEFKGIPKESIISDKEIDDGTWIDRFEAEVISCRDSQDTSESQREFARETLFLLMDVRAAIAGSFGDKVARLPGPDEDVPPVSSRTLYLTFRAGYSYVAMGLAGKFSDAARRYLFTRLKVDEGNKASDVTISKAENAPFAVQKYERLLPNWHGKKADLQEQVGKLCNPPTTGRTVRRWVTEARKKS